MAQAQPLILTQTANGTFLLPAPPGGGGGASILLTAQGFPVMNNGAPLVLNLQTGQTMQPFTLIQSSQLGQLVHSSVGVSPLAAQGQTTQTRPPAPVRGPVQSGSTFSAMQLPPTLALRPRGPQPVNLQVSQVGGVNTLKLAGSPTLPLGSANRVNRSPSLNITPGHMVVSPPATLAPTSEPPRVMMSVEEFYYGTYDGDVSLREPPSSRAVPLTCGFCSHLARNNLGLMQHTLQHSELIVGRRRGEAQKICKFCYRHFSSAEQLRNHLDQVHSTTLSPCMCRICEWAFENEPAFLNHMKSNHKPGEMPYVCQVCSYRSSFYSDILQHFVNFHLESRYMLCVFCLKVKKDSKSYQDHLLRHRANQASHCNRCRLQFVLVKDKQKHKLENHRSFRRPEKLRGLPPGSKVTIRTYGKMRPLMTSGVGRSMGRSSAPLIQPINIKTMPQKLPAVTNRGQRWPLKKPLDSKVSISRSDGVERLQCLECGTNASDFAAHYPTHVRCLLCLYSSCCSRAYAAHMINHHVPRSKGSVVPLHRRPPPCVFQLYCSGCHFRTQFADQMADHLLANPVHYSATCRPRTFVEPDIQLRVRQDQKRPEPDQEPNPSWRSTDYWTRLRTGDITDRVVIPFTEAAGPHHQLAKNSDALDFFNLLFPDALVGLITTETNAHAKTCRFLGRRLPDWVPVTVPEVKAFIGLVILMGIQNLPDISHYWSSSRYGGSHTFCRTMALERFRQIAANIRMGGFTADEYSGGTSSEPRRIFGPMLDLLAGAMWDTYRPNCSLVIDQAHLPGMEEQGHAATVAGHAPQPQVWLLCDSKSGYCHRFFVQLEEAAAAGGQEAGFAVVPELVKGLEEKHHHLYLANSLTSVPLLQKLLEQGVYASSSFPPPSAVLPRGLWDQGHLENPGDFLQWHHGPLLATRWRDVKEMGCLSTNARAGQPDKVWRRSPNKVSQLDPVERPLAFRLLQENMRGVDICKQLLACNPLGGVPLDRHWRCLFWFLVNLSVVNAFIVLRESRKDSPPPWVHDSLFTQVAFRKRLGDQLAKCAQKFPDSPDTPAHRVATTRAGVPKRQHKQHHRLVKISNTPHWCKNCDQKKVHRKTTSGCVTCQVHLCHKPGCFWEYHGLWPLHKGSTKVGFLREPVSGEVEQVPTDGDMAPLEDTDFSDEDDLDDLDLEDLDPKDDSLASILEPPGGTTPDNPTDGGHCLSHQQLQTLLQALCEGLDQASRVLQTDRQLIGSWLREARRRPGKAEPEPDWGFQDGGTSRLVVWVLSMREQQLPVTSNGLLRAVTALKKKGAFGAPFSLSYHWAVSFMLRHRLGVRRLGQVPPSLPLFLDAKAQAYRDFTQKVIRNHELQAADMAALDELCLFLDLGSVPEPSRRSEALGLSGSVPLLTVFLAVLSDGTMLPSLLLVNTPLAKRAVPPVVLLEAGQETLTEGEALDRWSDKVWHRHISGRTLPRKSLLILDRHRGHLGDAFLMSIGELRTLPAIIPAGCSSHLQPLEVCMKPVLQRLLLWRWAKFTAGNPKELEEASAEQLRAAVASVLVDWLLEALSRLSTLQDVWRTSFRLAQVHKEEEPRLQDIQSELIKTLTDTLLGPDAQEVGCPELEELEKEEEQHQRDMKMEEQKIEEKEEEGKTEPGNENQGTKEKEVEEETREELEEDSEEEGKETEEVSKERRETRIVIGEEVGDEWKMTVKSRTEGGDES